MGVTFGGVRRGLPVIAGLVLIITALVPAGRKTDVSPVVLRIGPARLPADGMSFATIAAAPAGATLAIVEGAHSATIEGNRLRAGVLPGTVVVEARAAGFAPARARLETWLVASDEAGDGTPDFLRLNDEADRQAFTEWFTFLAEAAAAGKPPDDVTDCAALVRYAYREALRAHDGRWAARLNLPGVPAIPAIRKYQYPFTPLGANLFRVATGAFSTPDLERNAFAEFADAERLMRRNCHFNARGLDRAERGDLLFFRQPGQRMPFHMMIYLGASHFESGAASFVVYHTGPDAHGPGEIRRPSVDELLAHPQPQWRPLQANTNFLGIYRWNILGD